MSMMNLDKIQKTEFKRDGVLTANQQYVLDVRRRRVGVQVSQLTEAQKAANLAYLDAAEQDLMSKLSEAEIAEVNDTGPVVEMDVAAIQRELDKNKDKPSH